MGKYDRRVIAALTQRDTAISSKTERDAEVYCDGVRMLASEWGPHTIRRLRHAVLMEGANVACEDVRDGKVGG